MRRNSDSKEPRNLELTCEREKEKRKFMKGIGKIDVRNVEVERERGVRQMVNSRTVN